MNREEFIEEFKRRMETNSPLKDVFVEVFVDSIDDIVEHPSKWNKTLIEEATILANVALHWPGKIDEYWVALVAMSAKAFVRAEPKTSILRKPR